MLSSKECATSTLPPILSYLLSPEAEIDLDKIWEYSVDTWSVNQAEKYYDDLIDGIVFLTKNSMAGRSIDYVSSGYRMFRVRHHLLVYRILPGAIDVIRILHERMDIEERLKE